MAAMRPTSELRRAPPGPNALELRGLRVHLLVSFWVHAKLTPQLDTLSPEGLGWVRGEDGRWTACYMTKNSAPPYVMSAVAAGKSKPGCGCKVCGCNSGRCGCFKAGLGCGEDCRCVNCQNPLGLHTDSVELEAAVVLQEQAEAEAVD